MRKQLAAVILGTCITFGFGSIVRAQAPATPATPAAPAVATPATATPEVTAGAPLRMESRRTLWDMIKAGGWAMWPLGACSFVTVGLIILNFQRVSINKMVPKRVIAQLKGAATAGDLQQLWNVSTTTDSFFTRAFANGLRQVQPDDPLASRAKVESALMETASREEARYAFFVNFLALLTSMAPLWGLLGTVSGMIRAFSTIGVGGMGKPEMLAKSISEALVCTATGLMIAIVAMGFYFMFRNILNTVMKESEAYFTEILDNLMGMENTLATAVANQAPQAVPAPAAEPQK